MVRSALFCTKPDGRYAYVCPQFNRDKNVAWLDIKRLTADIPNIQYNESEARADLANGARIGLYGADNLERLRGLCFDGVILDERLCECGEVIQSMLAAHKGWSVFIERQNGGKREGAGRPST
jgi:hypothetical protein